MRGKLYECPQTHLSFVHSYHTRWLACRRSMINWHTTTRSRKKSKPICSVCCLSDARHEWPINDSHSPITTCVYFQSIISSQIQIHSHESERFVIYLTSLVIFDNSFFLTIQKFVIIFQTGSYLDDEIELHVCLLQVYLRHIVIVFSNRQAAGTLISSLFLEFLKAPSTFGYWNGLKTNHQFTDHRPQFLHVQVFHGFEYKMRHFVGLEQKC